MLDCTSFVISFLTFRFINSSFFFDHFFDIFNHYSFFWSPFKFIVYQVIFMSHITPLLMAVNRATSLCFPVKYDAIWRNYSLIIGCAYLVLPTTLTWQLLFKPAGLFLSGNKSDGHLALDYDHSYTFGPRMSTALFWYSMGAAFLTLTCNLMCAIKLITHKFTNRALRKNNVRMVICAMIVFVNEALVMISQLIVSEELLDPDLTMRVVIPFIFDVHSLMPALIIICTVPQLRKVAAGGLFREDSVEKSLFVTRPSVKPLNPLNSLKSN
ncbi:unnamed protein product [Bursaphelenchus xylophilus]|uniref:Serpentine receptor class gamma n=1 Tax=Bursaphelenchus xylophilus TaxID=6326 RepID=A0A1I7RKI4_BURXY|nr:unnamed protein product [Bursaphelenchus xylophilus]CAG9131302.1 unnamed protein product [Bursaphelenchus xylophilus]